MEPLACSCPGPTSNTSWCVRRRAACHVGEGGWQDVPTAAHQLAASPRCVARPLRAHGAMNARISDTRHTAPSNTHPTRFDLDGMIRCNHTIQETTPCQMFRVATSKSCISSPLPPAQQALGLERGVFHVELKATSRGPRLIEVNCRMGGGPVRDTNLLVWGVDLVEENLYAFAGIPVRPPVAAAPHKQLAEYSINAQVGVAGWLVGVALFTILSSVGWGGGGGGWGWCGVQSCWVLLLASALGARLRATGYADSSQGSVTACEAPARMLHHRSFLPHALRSVPIDFIRAIGWQQPHLHKHTV